MDREGLVSYGELCIIFDCIGCGFHSLGVSHTDDFVLTIVKLGSTVKVVSKLSSDDMSLRGLIWCHVTYKPMVVSLCALVCVGYILSPTTR